MSINGLTYLLDSQCEVTVCEHDDLHRYDGEFIVGGPLRETVHALEPGGQVATDGVCDL